MRIFIAGIDGYLGWPLAQYLAARGHDVGGIDFLLRRQWVAEVGSHSIIPICDIETRLQAFEECFQKPLFFRYGNLLDYDMVCACLQEFQPDTIIHLGEMPSAAYSMIDARHTAFTQHNNVVGSLNVLWAIKEICPSAHLIKLGTMGEYGTPNIDIPEGFFEVEYKGRKDWLPFPRQAGSFYHWSKVHDSNNVMFACRTWGLAATDVMQGVVFGTHLDEMGNDPRLRSRLDFDQCFGTVIHRFCCQAIIGKSLSVYGSGQQKRSFLPLSDSMQCLTLAAENPARQGEYRVFNQFESCYSVLELAQIVACEAEKLGMPVSIEHHPNPRRENEQHYYNPECVHLIRLGYQPMPDIAAEIRTMIQDLLPHQQRILEKADVLLPDIQWNGSRRSQLNQTGV